MKIYAFVRTDHPAYRLGGMTDCIGCYDNVDDALAACEAHLNFIWARPNNVEIGYIDLLHADDSDVWHYKRYRHEPHAFFSSSTHIQEHEHAVTPY